MGAGRVPRDRVWKMALQGLLTGWVWAVSERGRGPRLSLRGASADLALEVGAAASCWRSVTGGRAGTGIW